MTDIPIALTSDELVEVLALPTVETMTLTRAFDRQTSPQTMWLFTYRRFVDGDWRWGWATVCPGDGQVFQPSPLGQRGDVLVIEYEIPSAYIVPTRKRHIHLTVLSVKPRIVDGTWVAEAQLQKE